jgi:lipopolysaccharide/colanic/teichoic acid biosynthesis glycosyltransferase
MELSGFFLISIVLFAIIYFAVRLAIIPLLRRQVKITTDEQNFELVKLRDMDILNNTELEWAIKKYQNKNDKNEGYEQYQKYAKILDELKEMGHFTDKRYCSRLDKLKEHFKVVK